jgi:hypothetical protein
MTAKGWEERILSSVGLCMSELLHLWAHKIADCMPFSIALPLNLQANSLSDPNHAIDPTSTIKSDRPVFSDREPVIAWVYLFGYLQSADGSIRDLGEVCNMCDQLPLILTLKPIPEDCPDHVIASPVALVTAAGLARIQPTYVIAVRITTTGDRPADS